MKQICSIGESVVGVFRNPSSSNDCKNCSSAVFDARRPQELKSIFGKDSTLVSCLPSTSPIRGEEAPYFDSPEYIQELLKVAASAGVTRFAYCSSGGTVYGEARSPSSFEGDILNPISYYGVAKVRGESVVRSSSMSVGVRPTIWRFANLYGERSTLAKRQGLIEHALTALRSGQPVRIFGDDEMVRDYVHVEDAARAAALTLLALPSHIEYNVGTGVGTSVKDVLALIEEKSGQSLARIDAAMPEGFVRHNVLNSDRITGEFLALRFRPLEQGLTQLLDDFELDSSSCSN